MRQKHTVAPFSKFPSVMTIFDGLSNAQFVTLNDIPHSLLFPPETKYSLACAILNSGDHYAGISLDLNISQGNHIYFDGMKKERVQVVSWMILLLNMQRDLKLLNYGM